MPKPDLNFWQTDPEPVLRIQDNYSGSRVRIFPVTDLGYEFFPSRILDPLNPKKVSKLSEIWSGLFIPDPDPDFYPSRIPGLKGTGFRIPDPESATLSGKTKKFKIRNAY